MTTNKMAAPKIMITLLLFLINIFSFLPPTAKILFFYLVFYALLIGYFSAMLAVFWQTLDPKMPKFQLSESLIGANPGEFLRFCCI